MPVENPTSQAPSTSPVLSETQQVALSFFARAIDLASTLPPSEFRYDARAGVFILTHTADAFRQGGGGLFVHTKIMDVSPNGFGSKARLDIVHKQETTDPFDHHENDNYARHDVNTFLKGREIVVEEARSKLLAERPQPAAIQTLPVPVFEEQKAA
ncbi:MAG: hypothetical protein Q8Q49_02025 [bacterium]|nr:hypothetical protein [bacterium]